jgi:hypothetical protein
MPPSDTTPSSATTTLPGFTGTSTSDPEAPSSLSTPGLSTAAQAGIGAGIGGLVLFAIVLGILLFMRRRKRRNNKARLPEDVKHNYEYKNVGPEEQPTAQVAALWQPPAELASGESVEGQKKGVVALPPNQPIQQQKMSSPVELDSRQPVQQYKISAPAELDSRQPR